MARQKGVGGKTPERVVDLLKDEVDKTSQAATARATGLTLRGVQNYLNGIGEPTTASLEKIAKYFKVSVAWLRGDEDSDRYIHKIEYSEKLVKECNVQNMAKFFKKLSLPEQENVAQMTGYFVALSLEQQRDLINSLVQHYYRVHGMPSCTEPMYDADGKAE